MEPAYILHRRVYKENSLLLDVFALNLGRVSLVAKGAHKAKSSRAASLQSFQPLLIQCSGRGSLKNLTKLDIPSQPFQLHGERLYSGYYINELLMRLLPEQDPNRLLFELYAEVLARVAADTGLKPLMRLFEVTLLYEIGQLPTLSEDWQHRPIDREQSYYLSSDLQLVPMFLSPTSSSLSSEAEAQQGITGLELGALCELLEAGRSCDFSDIESKIAWQACSGRGPKQFLFSLLDHALGGRPLNSREMLLEYMRLKSGASSVAKSR